MNEYSILELQAMMQSGNLTSRKIVESYFDHIKKIDANGPRLNSIIEGNPDALQIAGELDEECKVVRRLDHLVSVLELN
ncbi:hypothetical protein EU528_08935 [Candidatus Thorarchaeota archaeon]|nr:MAG: hypothetical protein EU528_08935 [Candidatus Thorarchaeota archaeon]